MIRRDIDAAEVARRAGRTLSTVRTWLAKGFPDHASRWAFEAALDYREAIWSSRKMLSLRRECCASKGYDPFLLKRPQLLEIARAAGIEVLQHSHINHIRQAVVTQLSASLRRERTNHEHDPNHTSS
jgi:hypothetical protein